MASSDKFNSALALISASVTFPASLAFMRINASFLPSHNTHCSKHLARQNKPYLQSRRGGCSYQWRFHSYKPKWCREFHMRSLQNLLVSHWNFPQPTANTSYLIHSLGHHLPFHLPAHTDDSQSISWWVVHSCFPSGFFHALHVFQNEKNHRRQNLTLEESGTKLLFTWDDKQRKEKGSSETQLGDITSFFPKDRPWAGPRISVDQLLWWAQMRFRAWYEKIRTGTTTKSMKGREWLWCSMRLCEMGWTEAQQQQMKKKRWDYNLDARKGNLWP